MDTFACRPTCSVSAIALTTDHPTEFIDLTARVQAVIADSAIDRGFVNIQTLHTTSAIVVTEAEPRLLGDFAALLEQLAPLARLIGEPDFGPVTRALIGSGEGAMFGLGLALGLTRRP